MKTKFLIWSFVDEPRAIRRTRITRMRVGLIGRTCPLFIFSITMPAIDKTTIIVSNWFQLQMKEKLFFSFFSSQSVTDRESIEMDPRRWFSISIPKRKHWWKRNYNNLRRCQMPKENDENWKWNRRRRRRRKIPPVASDKILMTLSRHLIRSLLQ